MRAQSKKSIGFTSGRASGICSSSPASSRSDKSAARKPIICPQQNMASFSSVFLIYGWMISARANTSASATWTTGCSCCSASRLRRAIWPDSVPFNLLSRATAGCIPATSMCSMNGAWAPSARPRWPTWHPARSLSDSSPSRSPGRTPAKAVRMSPCAATAAAATVLSCPMAPVA